MNHEVLATFISNHPNQLFISKTSDDLWIRIDIDKWNNFNIRHGESSNKLHVHLEDLSLGVKGEHYIKKQIQKAFGIPNKVEHVWIFSKRCLPN